MSKKVRRSGNFSQSEVKAIYRQWTDALAATSGLRGAVLSEHIRRANRESYALVLGDADLRMEDMEPKHVQAITLHRKQMSELMLSVVAQKRALGLI